MAGSSPRRLEALALCFLVFLLPGVSGCGGNLTAPTGGPVTSPNYPSNYGNNQDCEWLINVPAGSLIRLTFDSFDLEEDYDFLRIYDGASASAALLQELTGPQSVSPIASTSNVMFLRFTSDDIEARQGFNSSYTSYTSGQCWDPGVPANGIRDNNSNFTSGQTVRYTCMDGYWLLWGTANITCQSNGTWSGVPPTCGGCPTVVLYGGSDTLQAGRMTSYTMTGDTHGDRPVYYGSVTCHYLYYHKRAMEWFVGPQFNRRGVRVRDSALYADQINGTFLLLNVNGGGWVENPDVKIACSDDVPAGAVLPQSVGGATNCTRVRLHGGADYQPSLMTTYTRTDQTNGGRPVYVSDTNSQNFLHFVEDIKQWWVGPTIGERSGNAYVQNCAMTPDQIRSPWILFDGNQRQVVRSVTASCVRKYFTLYK
ncbi:PREDICTED: seizure 6-like protein [Branchiostoma belcheri]|uniref:Seizure 6-like protein n=1 Tax=Branchiostoma belcheri TaxID=7741 RepID=A0A6P4YC16_BRABE|nr:PREDICTED: seizure 6-like protein [Branchiostoma belcheri]